MTDDELLALARRIRVDKPKRKGRHRASPTQRAATLRASGGVCAFCGSGRGVHAHHRVPASRGGNARHLIASCRVCDRKDHRRYGLRG